METRSEHPIHFHLPVKPAGLVSASGNLLKKISLLFSSIKLSLPKLEWNRWLQPIIPFFQKAGSRVATATTVSLHHASVLMEKNRTSGFTVTMDDYEKRKLGIFNQLNLFQFLTGIIVPLAVFISGQGLGVYSALVILSPALVSILVLYLNSRYKHKSAMLCYFILYPFLTSLVYVNGMNLGIELFFILYGILSVFFLKEIGYMIFCLAFSMLNYFMLAVVLKEYQFYLEVRSPALYMFNHILAIVYIFYGLYLIKRENTGYQSGILSKNIELIRVNEEVQEQKEELNELNTFKNKLFSIISHDLKTPMYALRNLFQHINNHKVSAREIKAFIPEVVKDLNYTTSLMENLLQWAKSQMQADALRPQLLEVPALINDTIQLLRLQADAKKINLESRMDEDIKIYADKDMVSLVLRNLISNAIKFTPENGCVVVGAHAVDSFIEVYVRDTGTGLTEEALQKINGNNYFTTIGTANESGTGLGLMLCKEFLAKNGGRLSVESELGKGSIFSFTLPNS